MMNVPHTEVVVQRGRERLARYVVPPGEYFVGRDPACEICVEADLVSRRHVKLKISEDEWVVEDLSSANGTSVSGQSIAGSARVGPNETIQVGSVTIGLRWLRPEAVAPAPEAAPAVVREPAPREEKYELGEVVAKGGMGQILRARETATKRTVALKMMLDSRSPRNVERFLMEARVTAHLEHPNVVPVHELAADDHGAPFYTMKLVKGATLKSVLSEIGAGVPETVSKYPLAMLLTIFQKVCDALAFAHAKGVIHRDLKPENIMVGDYGEVLVMDWGLAKIIGRRRGAPGPREVRAAFAGLDLEDGSATAAGAVMGTPQFMAPEQARGEVESLDARSDIYALGAILYQILTLQLPIEGRTVAEILAKVCAGEITPPIQRALTVPHLPGGSVPESLSAVTMKALSHHPADRYPSVTEFQADIFAYQHGFATRAEEARLARHLMLFLRRHRTVLLGITAALVLCAAGFGVVQHRQSRARLASHESLVRAAEESAGRGEWDSAITALHKALGVLDRPAARQRLSELLLTGARADLAAERFGASAIKLQETLQISPGDAQAAQLMPAALGEGFVSIETKFPATLVEILLDENLAPIRGPQGIVRHGTLPIADLRLRAGVHQFEIHRAGRRWCSLPVEVRRAERTRIVIPITEIPADYEYIHEGEFIQGDEVTSQADGSLGKRSRRVRSFFIRSTLVTGEEYFRFRESADYERLITQELAAESLAASDLQAGARKPADLVAFKENVPNSEKLPVRGLSFYEAAAFAAWARARLPTEEEWEKAARGIDGRLFSGGLASPREPKGWGYSVLARSDVQTSPFGCFALTDNIWQWTSSRSESDSPRYIVKGGVGRGAVADRKPARRKPMDPKAKYHAVGVIFCRDATGAK